MGGIGRIADMLMCLLWVTTYALVLAATLKDKYPAISPITQAIIAPFEFAVTASFLQDFSLHYVSAAYLCWSLLEIGTIALFLQRQYIRPRLAGPYLAILFLLTCLMAYVIRQPRGTIVFSYLNTILGTVFWYGHVRRRDYPVTVLHLCFFVTKYCADVLGVITYFRQHGPFVSAMSVLLPFLDSIFILTWYARHQERQTDRSGRP